MTASLVLRTAWAATLLAPTLLWAQEIDNQATAPRYLVGLRLSDGPVYFGQRARGQDLRPVLALLLFAIGLAWAHLPDPGAITGDPEILAHRRAVAVEAAGRLISPRG